MIVSLPPDIIKPSGYSLVGGRVVTELMNAWPCDAIVPSYFGGVSPLLFHKRTVASRETETMVDGLGNATPLTYVESVVSRSIVPW
jgi:hypothetical protein